MAVITGTIVSSGEEVQINIPTARVNELPEIVQPFEVDDKVPIFDDSENKTVWCSLQDFRTYVLTGVSGGGTAPVVQGDVVEIPITSGMAGTNQVDVPSLENKTFKLFRRASSGQLLSTEYDVLPSGGFVLKDRDVDGNPVDVGTGNEDQVTEGEVFFAHIYELVATTPGPGTSNPSGLFNGIALISASTDLNATHRAKLIHIAAGTSKITVTLPDIADAAENEVIVIETNISNTYQAKIITKSSQLIYHGNTSQTELYIGQSEYLWLLKGDDGWYIIKASEGFTVIGQPFMDYTVRLNSLEAKGQTVLKANVPRLWKWLQANPDLYVTELAWQADTLKQGKFSEVDSTSIRMPDHQNQFYRGLNNLGGADTERPGNTPGLRQLDELKAHAHGLPMDGGGSDNIQSIVPSANSDEQLTEDNQTGETGGTETRGKNVGLIPLIRI
jgi:hypothetical protein